MIKLKMKTEEIHFTGDDRALYQAEILLPAYTENPVNMALLNGWERSVGRRRMMGERRSVGRRRMMGERRSVRR